MSSCQGVFENLGYGATAGDKNSHERASTKAEKLMSSQVIDLTKANKQFKVCKNKSLFKKGIAHYVPQHHVLGEDHLKIKGGPNPGR